MTSATTFKPITEWGAWLHELAQLPEEELAGRDIAEINLRCAEDLPGTDNELLGACLDKVDDWAKLVDEFTRHLYPHFLSNTEEFQNSESQFRVVALGECLRRYIGITYNVAFLEGDYDGSDSRNLFIHGILTGFGGTCASMPVLYSAIGRRLGYPLKLHLCNNKPIDIEAEITLRVGGKVDKASNDGSVTLGAFNAADWVQYHGHPAVNNSSTVVWKVKLKPGDNFEPVVNYHHFTRH